MARATAPRRPAGAAGAAAAGGDFWVQVGAFQDERNAERLAASLREGQLGVEVVRVIRGAAAGPDGTVSQHQVFVAGASVEAVTTALRGTGRSAQAAAGGVVVQPALPMREAVELSQKLKGAGLDASIRRVASAASGSGGGQALHVVRVGSYPTRAAAVAARRTVEARGIQGFVARGPAK